MADFPGNLIVEPSTVAGAKVFTVERDGVLIEIPPGYGGGGGGTTVEYLMRAYRALTPGYVHWTSSNTPDYAGTGSGYNPAELTDITVISYA